MAREARSSEPYAAETRSRAYCDPRRRRPALAGTPFRSASGKLTVTELITESGLRRDVVYGDYKDLLEEFQARVKAQDSTPGALRDLAGRNEELTAKLTEARAEPATERTAGAALRQIIAELSLELQKAREEVAAAGNVTRLPIHRNGVPAGSATDTDYTRQRAPSGQDGERDG